MASFRMQSAKLTDYDKDTSWEFFQDQLPVNWSQRLWILLIWGKEQVDHWAKGAVRKMEGRGTALVQHRLSVLTRKSGCISKFSVAYSRRKMEDHNCTHRSV